MSESIYPITQIYFRCDGCGAEWMIRPEPAIADIAALRQFTDGGKMGPCPKGCGAKTCSMLFRAGRGSGGVEDPFSLLRKP